jgi:hypothetical protein
MPVWLASYASRYVRHHELLRRSAETRGNIYVITRLAR